LDLGFEREWADPSKKLESWSERANECEGRIMENDMFRKK